MGFWGNPRWDFCLVRKEPTVLFLEEESEANVVEGRKGKCHDLCRRNVYHSVCSILSISKSVPPAHWLLSVPNLHNPTHANWGPCISFCSCTYLHQLVTLQFCHNDKSQSSRSFSDFVTIVLVTWSKYQGFENTPRKKVFSNMWAGRDPHIFPCPPGHGIPCPSGTWNTQFLISRLVWWGNTD